MKTRVISGIVIALVLAGVLFPGGLILASVLTIVSLISFFELVRATGVHSPSQKVNILEACGYLAIIVHYFQMIFVKSHKYFVFSKVAMVASNLSGTVTRSFSTILESVNSDRSFY